MLMRNCKRAHPSILGLGWELTFRISKNLIGDTKFVSSQANSILLMLSRIWKDLTSQARSFFSLFQDSETSEIIFSL